jgi:hypothetical protein
MADDERSDATGDQAGDTGAAGWGAPHLPPKEPAGEPTGGDAPAPDAPGDVAASAAAPGEPPAPPPASAPAPVGAPPPPPVTSTGRKRRGWLIVLLVVMGVIVLSFGVGTAFFVSNTLPPYQAADDFISDLADARFEAAADQLCRADRDDADEAISIVTRRFVGQDEYVVNPLSVDRDGNTATVEVSLSVDDSDESDTFELPLREEGGEWRPCPGLGLR